METKRKTCQVCPYPLPENGGYLISGRKVKGEITYKELCRECYQIAVVVAERKEEVKKEHQRNLQMKRKERKKWAEKLAKTRNEDSE